MNDELRDRIGRFSQALTQLAESLTAQHDAPTVEPSPVLRDCMTRKQVAEYLQVSEQSITNWQSRAEYPLPCGYAGDQPRYFLSDVKQWSIEEGQRRAVNKSRRAKKPSEDTKSARKMPSTLTVATKREGDNGGDIQALPGTTH